MLAKTANCMSVIMVLILANLNFCSYFQKRSFRWDTERQTAFFPKFSQFSNAKTYCIWPTAMAHCLTLWEDNLLLFLHLSGGITFTINRSGCRNSNLQELAPWSRTCNWRFSPTSLVSAYSPDIQLLSKRWKTLCTGKYFSKNTLESKPKNQNKIVWCSRSWWTKKHWRLLGCSITQRQRFTSWKFVLAKQTLTLPPLLPLAKVNHIRIQ